MPIEAIGCMTIRKWVKEGYYPSRHSRLSGNYMGRSAANPLRYASASLIQRICTFLQYIK